MSEAHFQNWCATYAYAILDDVHVKLAAPSTKDVPCVDSKALNARIITFHPFYFSLCFTFPLSKFFKKHADVLEVSGWREGKVDDGPLVPLTYYDGNDMSKKLDLKPDMAKVRRALNIPVRFREWRCLFMA
ncbi:unnamed protein product [Prunus brigantina]